MGSSNFKYDAEKNYFKKFEEKEWRHDFLYSGGDLEVIHLLLKTGANPNVTNYNGDAALDIAMMNGN